MFGFALGLHNVLRWVIVAVALWALIRAYSGWLRDREWSSQDAMAGRFLTIAFDVQFLVGLFVSALSPLIRVAIQNPGQIGASEAIRYFATEHIPAMVVALVGVHLTSALVKRLESDSGRHRRAAIGYSLSTLLVILAIPWWRPLLPLA